MFVRSVPKAALAVLSLALLTACGDDTSAALPAPSSPAPQEQSAQYRVESAIADCMKQQGFRYVPYLPEEKTEEEIKLAAGDYAAMRRYREKYGFGVWSRIVYPKELGTEALVNPDDEEALDPNVKIQESLSGAQRGAYEKARDECLSRAVKEVTGKEVSSFFDRLDKVRKRWAELKARELDGDARLVRLAGQMADCLKGKGYAVESDTPVALAERGLKKYNAEMNRVSSGLHTPPPGVKEDPPGIVTIPSITADEARPYLTREIKEALDDLECGREFYAAYAPKEADIGRRVSDEYGFGE